MTLRHKTAGAVSGLVTIENTHETAAVSVSDEEPVGPLTKLS